MSDLGNPITDAVSVFEQHDVQNVLVGGAAVILHGSAYVTQDVDFCCKWDDEHLERLAIALTSMHAKLRVQGVPQGVPVKFDVKYLRQYTSVALDTDIGFVDVRKTVDGIGGYDQVVRLSEEHNFGQHRIRLLSLDGLIQSKSYMGRPRDLMLLPELKMMREARQIEAGLDIKQIEEREQDEHSGEK